MSVGQDDCRLDIVYGPDRQRWKSTLKKNNVAVKTTIFAGDYEEITEGGATKYLYYISDDNGLAAVYVKQSGQSDKIYYACTDHLGSIIKLVDGNGAKVFEATYDAWGKQTVSNSSFKFYRGYTGHEHLPEFNLIDMNGRMYDPLLGRFLSPDPFVQSPEFSQSFNRYSYCLNNPLRYTDPDGEWAVIDDLIAAVIGGTINLISNAIQGNIHNLGDGLAAFGAGGAAGTLALYGPAGWAAGGAIVGGTNAYLGGAKGWDIVNGSVIGTISGLAGGAAGQWAAQNIGGVVISGLNVTSPVIKGAIGGAIGGAAGGYAGGFTAGMITTGDIRQANKAGLNGLYSGAAIGGITGSMSGYKYAKKEGKNPWTGKELRLKGNYTVYQGIDPATNDTKYIGITKRDPQERWNEHLNSGSNRARLRYQTVETGLTKIDARIMEQSLINQYGLGKNGGNLYNNVNSINPRYWNKYGIK